MSDLFKKPRRLVSASLGVWQTLPFKTTCVVVDTLSGLGSDSDWVSTSVSEEESHFLGITGPEDHKRQIISYIRKDTQVST